MTLTETRLASAVDATERKAHAFVDQAIDDTADQSFPGIVATLRRLTSIADRKIADRLGQSWTRAYWRAVRARCIEIEIARTEAAWAAFDRAKKLSA